MQIKSKGKTYVLGSCIYLGISGDYIFCFVLKVCKKTNIQLNIYPHNTLYNNLGGVYSVMIHITT